LPKLHPMRKFIPLIIIFSLIVLVFFVVFRKKDTRPDPPKPPKEQPIAVSKYSDSFRLAVTSVLDKYYALSEAFVNWDSGAVSARATELSVLLEKISMDEIRKDTLIYETAVSYRSGFKTDLDAINADAKGLEEKRRSFHSFSQNLFDLLRTIRFDAAKVYVQECNMAFNDNESAIWLSNKPEIRNPYLGLHHPRYKAGMIDCGDVKDSLRFGVTEIKTESKGDGK
jgi:hypothetical protein